MSLGFLGADEVQDTARLEGTILAVPGSPFPHQPVAWPSSSVPSQGFWATGHSDVSRIL